MRRKEVEREDGVEERGDVRWVWCRRADGARGMLGSQYGVLRKSDLLAKGPLFVEEGIG